MLLTIVDSSKTEYRYVQEGFLAAFGHFGLPYRVVDLAKEELTPEKMLSASVLVIAQEGIGERFSAVMAQAIKEALEESGLGLVNFDHRLLSYPSPLRNIFAGLNGSISFIQSRGLRIEDEHHFLTQTYEKGQRGEFLGEMELAVLSSEKRERVLVASLEGHPLLRLFPWGRGRVVQFFISPKMWHADYFGHCRGFDALFWKSLVWAARKPLIMMAMPPFVTVRIDDASGSASIFGKGKRSANKNFAYLGLFNKYGYIPNIGLYLDDITESDGRIIKERYARGGVEFSPHAFRDPENTNAFPIYMLPDGKEFSLADLRRNFARVDRKFQKWGIRPSRTVNAHFGQMGLRALPFLKERGQVYTMNPIRLGKTWTDKEARDWKPGPYGYSGYNLDYLPEAPDFFNVCSGMRTDAQDYLTPSFDFLYSCTPFWEENSHNDLRKAALRGAAQIKEGLDSGFFGCLMAHEQRIAALSEEEWEEILKDIDNLTSKYEKIFQSYDYIAEYAKSRASTRIVEASYNSSGKIKLKLAGKATLPLKIYLFNEDCQREIKEIPPFTGEKEVVLLPLI